MSVTFFLQSGETSYPSCPSCGGNMRHEPAPSHDCEHEDCLGYGPDPIESTPSLNVTNDNARVLLRTILDIDVDADLCGALDADDLKLRLSMAGYRTDGAVRPTIQECRLVDFGLSVDRIGSYIESLSKLAELASRRGEPICFG